MTDKHHFELVSITSSLYYMEKAVQALRDDIARIRLQVEKIQETEKKGGQPTDDT